MEIEAGDAAVVAARLAGLIRSGNPDLAATAIMALVEVSSAAKVGLLVCVLCASYSWKHLQCLICLAPSCLWMALHSATAIMALVEVSSAAKVGGYCCP